MHRHARTQIQRSGGNGSACHAQMYIMGTLLRHGSDEQKAAYLPAIAAGELRLQAFGVTEPTSGSGARTGRHVRRASDDAVTLTVARLAARQHARGTETLALRTTAVRSADGASYVVNGQKVWTSRAEHSDLMLLLARTSPRGTGASRTDGLSVFLVDMRDALAVRPRVDRTPRARAHIHTSAWPRRPDPRDPPPERRGRPIRAAPAPARAAHRSRPSSSRSARCERS